MTRGLHHDGAGICCYDGKAMDSPCVKVCVIEPASGLCAGCKRTLAEIARWTSMSVPERRRIISELAGRRLDRMVMPS